ncbi:MAG TPA: cytochrome c oxidase assembly protein [Dongiaceae bacterium]|jgi:cytochrome c oxidase assembly protein subunit 11|nr:cytochrome c oxidase assembly protein [Dongiaceae bacterium]
MNNRHNLKTAAVLAGIVASMIGLSLASVPLYRLFCQVTGYNGTTQRAVAVVPAHPDARVVRVFFSATVARGLPWKFYPELTSVAVRVGEQKMVSFIAENEGDAPVTGQASYNVWPDIFGAYFTKIQCFCFTQQTLQPHEKVRMPVVFFLDPALLSDPLMKSLNEVTLAYTFFAQSSPGQKQTN